MYVCLHEAIWYGMVLTGLIVPQCVDCGFKHTRTSMQPCFAPHPCQPPTQLMSFQIAKTNVGGDGDVVCMKLAGMVFIMPQGVDWI